MALPSTSEASCWGQVGISLCKPPVHSVPIPLFGRVCLSLNRSSGRGGWEGDQRGGGGGGVSGGAEGGGEEELGGGTTTIGIALLPVAT